MDGDSLRSDATRRAEDHLNALGDYLPTRSTSASEAPGSPESSGRRSPDWHFGANTELEQEFPVTANGDYSTTEEMSSSDGVASDTGAAGFDTALPASHSYLGAVEDLERNVSLLEHGHTCSLPLILLEGVVLMPGMSLPLRFCPGQAPLIEGILQAPEPYTRLLAVAGNHWRQGASHHFAPHHHRAREDGEGDSAVMACTAEVRQMRRERHGITFVAVGRQRAELLLKDGQSLCREVSSYQHTVRTWPLQIHCEPSRGTLPREVRAGGSFWQPWVHRLADPSALAEQAASLFSSLFPKAKAFQGDPEELAWWLSANLPLEHETRQAMLEAPCAASRLSTLCNIMRKQRCLCCSSCKIQVARISDVMAMSESGAAAVFLNPSGYLHDMVTLASTVNIIPMGLPETANSWFPGYAWTLSYCRGCRQHLGWKFTAIAPNHTHPASFWGLRRMALTENTAHRNEATSRGLQHADQLPDIVTGGGWVRGERRVGTWVLRDLIAQHLI
ncbi:hypothetical protein WJX73_009938 [Symbiochloris irregularis]|uniref:Protein cereblon n=1 Tax=Symbiochloris irregularis TaxID=706552 RepID=A0AAW1PK83_9CHLO